MDDLVKLIERELDVSEMVLADPLTLRRLKAKRIARVVTEFFAQAHRELLDAERFHQFPDICTFVTQEQADLATANMLLNAGPLAVQFAYLPDINDTAGIPVA